MARKFIRSNQFAGVYLRIDGSTVKQPAGPGAGAVNCQFGVGAQQTFELGPQSDGTVTIGSTVSPNVFLRLDGSNVRRPAGSGAGVVNCQFTAGPYEKFRLRPQPNGTVAIESAAFPGVFLRMDGSGITQPADSGAGVVNAQFGAGPYEQFVLEDLRSILSTPAVRVTNNTGADVYFLEGTPNAWHAENGGVHTLIVPGYGSLRFVDGETYSSPNSSDRNERVYYRMFVQDPLGGQWGLFHNQNPLLITLEDDGRFSITTVGAINPIWSMTGVLRGCAPWLRQLAAPVGEPVNLVYDTSWYGATNVDIILVAAADDHVAEPPVLLTLSARGQGTVAATSMPTVPAAYVFKTRIDGFAALTVGRLVILPPRPAMGGDAHIHSIAAASTSAGVHFLASLLRGGQRTLWRTVLVDGASDQNWSLISDPTQPLTEIEIAITRDQTPLIFALDDRGYVHTKAGDAPWLAAPWGGQSVPFRQMTSCPQGGAPRMVAMDDVGRWWQTTQSTAGTWSNWASLPDPIGDGAPLVFLDIASAGSWLAGVNHDGRLWLSADGQSWIAATASSGSLPRYVSTDVTLDTTGASATLWGVDASGRLWLASGVQPGAAPGLSLASAAGFAPPVPLGDVFCAIRHGADVRLWGVSNSLALWSGLQGQALWEGPSWAGFRASSARNLLGAAAAAGGATARSSLYMTAAAASGTALWYAVQSTQGDWNGWYSLTGPSTASVRQLATPKGAAGRLWALCSDKTLYWATPGEDPKASVWTQLAGVSALRVASARLPDGSEAVWIVTSAGDVQIASSASQFATFTSTGAPSARAIAAFDTTQAGTKVTVLAGLNSDGTPFDLTQTAGGGSPGSRSPAFGVAAPSGVLVQIAIGRGSSTDGYVAVGLDNKGWIWAYQSGATAWTGPRAYSQPAQFSGIEVGLGWIFAIDSLGTLWACELATGIWSGPNWANASSLGSVSRRASAPAARSRIALDVHDVHTSSRALTTVSIAAGSTATQANYPFSIPVGTTTAVATISAPNAFKYRVVDVAGRRYPNSTDEAFYGKDSAFELPDDRRKGVVLPVQDPSISSRPVNGDFKINVLQQGGGAWASVTAYAYTRTQASIPPGMTVNSRQLVLPINPMIAWLASTSNTDKTDFRRMTTDARNLISNFFGNNGLTVEWSSPSTPEHDIAATLSQDFAAEPAVSLLRVHGVSNAVNLVWTPQISPVAAGIAGGIAAVPLPSNEGFGILVAMLSGGGFSVLSPSMLCLNTAHEIGHLLGLTHESSANVSGNLMRTDPSKYGNNLNSSQKFILNNAVLVEERVTLVHPTAKVDRLKIFVTTGTRSTGDWLDGPGTDGDVALVIWNKALTDKLISKNLDRSFHDDFESGNTDLFDRSLGASEAFDADQMGRMKIEFSGTFFDRIWNLNGLKVEGYSGDALRFVFDVQNINAELRVTGRNWWDADVGSANTQFHN